MNNGINQSEDDGCEGIAMDILRTVKRITSLFNKKQNSLKTTSEEVCYSG